MTPVQLLLLSNSKNTGADFMDHAREPVARLLGERHRKIAFLPYAAVRFSYDKYETAVADVFPDYDIASTHRARSPRDLVAEADAIAVGGGNTFCLIDAIYRNDLLRIVRERVAAGVPYIGWSAGSNVACPTICTTNDMPIVDPPAFLSFDLIPFQINPHYVDGIPNDYMGETREERIEEYLRANVSSRVLGLREGVWLERNGDVLTLEGENGARYFQENEPPKEFSPGTDLSFLLETAP